MIMLRKVLQLCMTNSFFCSQICQSQTRWRTATTNRHSHHWTISSKKRKWIKSQISDQTKARNLDNSKCSKNAGCRCKEKATAQRTTQKCSKIQERREDQIRKQRRSRKDRQKSSTWLSKSGRIFVAVTDRSKTTRFVARSKRPTRNVKRSTGLTTTWSIPFSINVDCSTPL